MNNTWTILVPDERITGTDTIYYSCWSILNYRPQALLRGDRSLWFHGKTPELCYQMAIEAILKTDPTATIIKEDGIGYRTISVTRMGINLP